MNELFNEKRTKRRNAQHSGQLAAAAQQAKIGGIESFAAGGSDERTLPHRFGLGRPLRRRVGVVERRVEHQFAVQRQRQGQHGLVDAVARQRRRIHDARLQDQVEEDSPQGGQHHVQRRSRVRFLFYLSQSSRGAMDPSRFWCGFTARMSRMDEIWLCGV